MAPGVGLLCPTVSEEILLHVRHTVKIHLNKPLLSVKIVVFGVCHIMLIGSKYKPPRYSGSVKATSIIQPASSVGVFSSFSKPPKSHGNRVLFFVGIVTTLLDFFPFNGTEET